MKRRERYTLYMTKSYMIAGFRSQQICDLSHMKMDARRRDRAESDDF
jgi:hypothetical protein